ncbi:hypothetical protein E2C01_091562 [Portunus trituberculatus]|uniref:Uncharacterized protein n=1 Tax=Portunus trituberculatus TaxID=210409 RepID=A0A5B7JE98_PORTR|nr:hypothetical protein [Portunus trituberculatus]
MVAVAVIKSTCFKFCKINSEQIYILYHQSWALPYIGPHLRSSVPADHQTR